MSLLDSILDSMADDIRFSVERVLYSNLELDTPSAVTVLFTFNRRKFSIWTDPDSANLLRIKPRPSLIGTTLLAEPNLEKIVEWIENLVPIPEQN